MATVKGTSPQLNSSQNVEKFTAFGSDIDLTTRPGKPKRAPRMIWWNSGDLNVDWGNGTTQVLSSEIAAIKWEWAPERILSASTTATIVWVTW